MGERNVGFFRKDALAAAGIGSSFSEAETPRADFFPPGWLPPHPLPWPELTNPADLWQEDVARG